MKTKTIITDKTNRQAELLRSAWSSNAIWPFFVFGLVVLTLLYRSVIIELRHKSEKCHEIESKLLDQRHKITAIEFNGNTGIIGQNEAALAISELAEKGRQFGLDFVTVSPEKFQETEESGIGKLPVVFKIESEFKDIGQFLTHLEGSSKTILEVESLFIRTKNQNSLKLDVELVLNMYVEIDDEA